MARNAVSDDADDADDASVAQTRLATTVRSLSRTQYRGLFLGALVVLAAIPHLAGSYITQVTFSIFMFTGLAYGWNFLSGFTGYINFGYAGFVGFGAYLTVLTIVDLGFPWPLALVTAMVVTAVVGTTLSIPMLRLRGAYFAIAMLAAATGARLFFSSSYMRPITRGGSGISFFPELDLTGQYYLIVTITLCLIYLTYRIANSPFGLRLLAIRDDETLAASLGVKTVREKIIGMAIHTAVAGLIGGVLAFNISYIDPTSVFNIQYTEFPIVMVLFGGLGTVFGPLLGGIIFVVLYELLWSAFPQAYQFFFGVAIIAIILFMPEGIIEYLKENDYLPRWRSI
ncbi:branched-chain amino acid ABC transporter permease [Halopenitus sp. POP-27]|uniref:branched-chain amino acid ABC transporter permease n=1 Tax=Halopenitus sp. POP-27 TaxID=2994425 RepID=UPI002468E196|nr:branched-chain amino acid ABC transporter permease [Halopenitus sp. POP-27]